MEEILRGCLFPVLSPASWHISVVSILVVESLLCAFLTGSLPGFCMQFSFYKDFCRKKKMNESQEI